MVWLLGRCHFFHAAWSILRVCVVALVHLLIRFIGIPSDFLCLVFQYTKSCVHPPIDAGNLTFPVEISKVDFDHFHNTAPQISFHQAFLHTDNEAPKLCCGDGLGPWHFPGSLYMTAVSLLTCLVLRYPSDTRLLFLGGAYPDGLSDSPTNAHGLLNDSIVSGRFSHAVPTLLIL